VIHPYTHLTLMVLYRIEEFYPVVKTHDTLPRLPCSGDRGLTLG
jgi:hypothetical protein